MLPEDVAQIQYQELVKSLKNSSGDSNREYSNKTTAELLTKEADELREKLRQAKIMRLKLEETSEKADHVVKKLESLEEVVSSLQNDFPGSLKEFVLRNITLAASIQVPNGLKKA